MNTDEYKNRMHRISDVVDRAAEDPSSVTQEELQEARRQFHSLIGEVPTETETPKVPETPRLFVREWGSVAQAVIDHVEGVRQDGCGIKNPASIVFELAMEVVYGGDIWNEYNKIYEGEGG